MKINYEIAIFYYYKIIKLFKFKYKIYSKIIIFKKVTSLKQ